MTQKKYYVILTTYEKEGGCMRNSDNYDPDGRAQKIYLSMHANDMINTATLISINLLVCFH